MLKELVIWDNEKHQQDLNKMKNPIWFIQNRARDQNRYHGGFQGW